MGNGPWPNPAFPQQVAEVVMPPLADLYSGEFSANITNRILGAPRDDCRISDAWFSVSESGRDDTDTLRATLDVKINGTTCISTNPSIDGAIGKASEQRTTKISGEGAIQGVIATANLCSPGDVITYDLTLTRTTPDTEMAGLVVVVEFEPI
nr:hypothetical protein 13 [bacterium]